MPFVPKIDWADGDKLPAADMNRIEQGVADAGTPAWNDITGKPSTFAPTIGTTATTAKAGNYTPPNVTTTANGLMLSTDKVKLDGIATGATANDTDANLKNRANHTGTQPFTTLSGTATAAQIPSLDAAKIASGTFAIAQIPTGTTVTTVALGNHTHAASVISVTATGTLTGANVQAALEALAARIAALETP